MAISLKPEFLKRYKDIAVLFMKYGRSDLVKTSGLSLALGDDSPEVAAAAPEASELAADLERLGPTFIKLGQLLSTRADILPPPYLEALARLQDNVGPFSFADVERIVEDDLGVRLSKAFNRFDSIPMASASLGQVHRAEMRDGREVVVKIQRPDIREQITQDVAALEELATFLDSHTEMGKRYDFAQMLSEFRKSLLRELDYRDEAGHLIEFAENLRDFDLLIIPRPVEDFTSSRVLTMDYIHGKKITALHPIRRLEINGKRLAEQFFRAYLQQILVDGVFHADPHPGNVFLTEDERIALLDLGMVSRIMSGFQDNLLRLLLAISDGRGEEAADITIRMGTRKENFQEEDFIRDVSDIVARHTDTSMNKVDAGRVVLEIQRIAADRGFRLPPEFTMIAKALLNLDQVVYTLAPDFDPNSVIRRYASELMQQRILKSLAPGNLMTNLLDVKDFLERLPSRVNKILDAVGNNELELKVDAIDEKKLMEGLQKVANRITVGLVIAAMIIGASLLMRVETSFKLFGYPGLAIIFFLLAAAAAIWLVVIILYYDETAEK
ncbi:MAG TPA: AarF/UbiB family protein [Pyrinomonadaceae bacterium]|jgi:predicted unusual protein kinase regulating ubiquinone biosynthesis (AarF/ABC1/UbiB family)|nr:AarF/UbiB family protein [Pyrinomonadaceae bacterium]